MREKNRQARKNLRWGKVFQGLLSYKNLLNQTKIPNRQSMRWKEESASMLVPKGRKKFKTLEEPYTKNEDTLKN